MNGKSDADIKNWVLKNAYPLVGELTPENYQFFMDRGLDLMWVGLDLDSKEKDNNIEIYKKGVSNFKGKYS